MTFPCINIFQNFGLTDLDIILNFDLTDLDIVLNSMKIGIYKMNTNSLNFIEIGLITSILLFILLN